MSLQIWLPLNGNVTENIANRPIVSNYEDITDGITDGKVTSKALSFNDVHELSYELSTEDQNMINNAANAFSIGCWAKLDPSQSSSFGQIITIGQKRGTDWTALRICLEGYKSTGVYFTISDGNSATTSTCRTNSNIYNNTWHHIMGVFNNGQLILYVDGIAQILKATTSIRPVIENGHYLCIGGNGSEKTKSCINDVRFYNHALSPREVKLLAQGLVAHYKLNNGNHTNLISGSYNFSGIVSSGGTTQSDPITGIISRKYNNTTTDYWELAAWNNIITANANDIYTVSFLARSENATKLTIYLWNNNSGVQVSNIKSSQGHNKSDSDGNCELQLTTEWKQYWITWTFNSTTTPLTKNLLFRLFKNNAAEIAHIKLEKGSIPTQYGLSPSEMNQFGYDCSGYGNHGTASATFEMSTDSPRYSNSTLFKDNKYIQTIRNNYEGMKNTYSFVYWAKHPISSMNSKMVWGFYDSSQGKYLDLFPSGGKFTLNNGGIGSNLAFNVNCPTDGQWHHYAVVGDTTKVYLYIDGQYGGQTTTLYEIPNAPLVLSGWTAKNEYRWNNGSISDFRIYATALSAAAVKELYESSISFLNNGTLQCSEIVEKDTNIKYNKNGIVQTEKVEETNTNLKLYNDKIQTYQIYEL